MKEYEYSIAGCAFDFAPVLTQAALLSCSDTDALAIPECNPFRGPWGQNVHVDLLEESFHRLPKGLHLIYLSIIEKRGYIINDNLPQEKLNVLWELVDNKKDPIYEKIIVGMAPYGIVVVWANGLRKASIIYQGQGHVFDITIDKFLPERANSSISELCNIYIDNNLEAKSYIEKNGLPPRDLFDRYMQQFIYRYVVEFGHWDEEKKEWKDYAGDEVRPEFEYIEEALYDGTHDKLHDGGLMQYHAAGKPKKLALQYHVKKSVYSGYLWFEDFKIRAAFENFYREYPEAEMDFLFRIDPEKNIYQILFTCKEAEHPVPLHEEAYQMIVFKSKFERYRTKNYNQPRGAWIW